MSLQYPGELIRGIPNSDFIDNEGRVSALLFQFYDVDRLDGFSEASINWYDNEHALELTLDQKKQNDNDTYQFKVGAAIISRVRLDAARQSPNAKGAISYERRVIEGNPYHGNILLKSGLTKQIRTMLAGNIAMCTERIIYR